MINAVIFSKNRPAQLELLLRSMKVYFFEWPLIRVKILYKATTQEYASGYLRTKLIHSEFQYIEEQPGLFKDQTISMIDENLQATMFFVDDMVFKSNLFLKTPQIQNFLENSNIACVSLRLCHRIKYCYTEKKNTPPPLIAKDGTWYWKGLPGDWGYSNSLDANIYRTKDILPLIKDLSYSSPNTLEGNMATHTLDKPYMICYPESAVFNIPVNKVQTDNANHYGNISAEALNKEFLSSKRISLSNIDNFKNISCHQEIPLVMENHIISLETYTKQGASNISEGLVIHTPDAIVDLISSNKIDYSKIISDDRFYKSIKEEVLDITILIPVKDRISFFNPSVHYLKTAANLSSYKIKIVYVENDYTPKFKNMCAEAGTDYIFIPTEISQSNRFFAKSLCYNIGYILTPKTKWYIFHDLDILVDKDFFIKLGFYIQKSPRWIQSYTKKRVLFLSENVTRELRSNNFLDLSKLTDKDAVAPYPMGSTWGSIAVRSNVFEEIGGYDPEIFYGYAPEDIFFWTKLEASTKRIDHINSCFQGGGLYADDPAIEVYHMSHERGENSNPHHMSMRNILGSFFGYKYEDKMKIIYLKRDFLENNGVERFQNKYPTGVIELYKEIIKEGDIVFDIGSNIGLKTDLFLNAGAKAICVEPQPGCVAFLINKYRDNKNVNVVSKALSDFTGTSILRVPKATTLGTLSEKFIESTSKIRFKDQLWDTQIKVEVTTINKIIETYGMPVFCKIDVEGGEVEVLKGLSAPIKCISIEFTPELYTNAEICVDHLLSIDSSYRFNYSPEETYKFHFENWADRDTLLSYLRSITDYEVSFGDIYAKIYPFNRK